MKVRMKVSMAGPDEAFAPGAIREVSAEVAHAWREAGIAEPVSADEIETTSAEPAGETAVSRKGKK